MITLPVILTLEVRTEDGSCTEFFEDEVASVHTALRLLNAPRLFAQPMLVMASEESISMIPSRTIDMLLARTLIPVPLQWPRGLADIVEVPECENSPGQSAKAADSEAGANATTMRLHLYTVGGWVITLELTPVAQLTVPDQRVLLAHFFGLPAIPFRLAAGGIGLLNPSQIIRATGQPSTDSEYLSKWPGLNAVPNTALPVHLLRWSPGVGNHRLNSSKAS